MARMMIGLVVAMMMVTLGSASVIKLEHYAIDTGLYVVPDKFITKQNDSGFFPPGLTQSQESFIYAPFVGGTKIGTMVTVSVGKVSPFVIEATWNTLRYDENISVVGKPYPGFVTVDYYNDTIFPVFVMYMGIVDNETLILATTDNEMMASFFFSQLSVHPVDQAGTLAAKSIARSLR
ncbi:MAG: hypothetical protein A4E44_00398 [Methanosaeta sp. PtaB.Bin018]|jgi:hypothetical protein|nr:MAG: hypothetical protein A4E44_00398 [Methanosaeta sp. PtaB.Bin018]OPY48147.1 MAG: hypothetical protein A4E46_00063 [Methanosaeta sp. PtaU1.Bin016]